MQEKYKPLTEESSVQLSSRAGQGLEQLPGMLSQAQPAVLSVLPPCHQELPS